MSMQNLEHPFQSSNITYKQELYTAIKAARAGKEVLMNSMGRLKNIEKKFKAGLVSEADKMAEKAITQVLLSAYPTDIILGEETASDTDLKPLVGQNKRRWIIDPLDGTTNYIHQFPVFAVSIALEVNGVVQVAVIDVPMMSEVYTSIKGFGSYLNGNPLQVSSCQNLEDAFLSTGFFAEHDDILEEQMVLFKSLVNQVRAIRRPGAAAYDMALVAKGVFDGFWERGLKAWDSAAGLLLILEAGGVVKNFHGEDYHPFHKSVICGNSFMVNTVLNEFKKSKVRLLPD